MSGAWPTARMTVSAGRTASVSGANAGANRPCGVEHRRDLDGLQAGDAARRRRTGAGRGGSGS